MFNVNRKHFNSFAQNFMFTYLQYMSSPPVFSAGCDVQSLVFCVVCYWGLFVLSFGLCVVCPSLIKNFWWPLWYLQTLITKLLSRDMAVIWILRMPFSFLITYNMCVIWSKMIGQYCWVMWIMMSNATLLCTVEWNDAHSW